MHKVEKKSAEGVGSSPDPSLPLADRALKMPRKLADQWLGPLPMTITRRTRSRAKEVALIEGNPGPEVVEILQAGRPPVSALLPGSVAVQVEISGGRGNSNSTQQLPRWFALFI